MRLSERGVGEQRDARLDPELARRVRRFGCDIRELFGGRHVVHVGVGDQDAAPAAERQAHADHMPSGFRVDHTADVFEGTRPIARDAGHHALREPECHHQRGEDVALVLHHPQAVAPQIAAPLKPPIKVVRELLRERRAAGIDDLEFRPQPDSGLVEATPDRVFGADQDRNAEPLRQVGIGGADDGQLFAVGEHDAFRRGAHGLENRLQPVGDGIEAAFEPRHVAVHVDDRPPRDTGLHRGLRDRRRDTADEARIERRGDDVVRTERETPPEERCRDGIRHVLARERRQRLGGRDLHGVVDGARLHVERAAENERKAEDVVDLVRIVGAPGRDDGVVAHRLHFLGRDFGIGVRHGEDDRLGRHRRHHLGRHRALGRKAEEHVRSGDALARGSAPCVFEAKPDFHWFIPALRPS